MRRCIQFDIDPHFGEGRSGGAHQLSFSFPYWLSLSSSSLFQKRRGREIEKTTRDRETKTKQTRGREKVVTREEQSLREGEGVIDIEVGKEKRCLRGNETRNKEDETKRRAVVMIIRKEEKERKKVRALLFSENSFIFLHFFSFLLTDGFDFDPLPLFFFTSLISFTSSKPSLSLRRTAFTFTKLYPPFVLTEAIKACFHSSTS